LSRATQIAAIHSVRRDEVQRRSAHADAGDAQRWRRDVANLKDVDLGVLSGDYENTLTHCPWLGLSISFSEEY
jgi:hypothetical protein